MYQERTAMVELEAGLSGDHAENMAYWIMIFYFEGLKYQDLIAEFDTLMRLPHVLNGSSDAA